MIQSSGLVVSYFGYWPDFCDGRIVSFLYEAPDLLEMSIYYLDADKNLGARIQIRFVGVSNVGFLEFRSENVLDLLQLTEGKPNHAVIEAAYGLSGSFSFRAAEVVSLVPDHTTNQKR